MQTSCPHCHKELKLSDAQRAKLLQALQALEAGKTLTVKCPACQGSIGLPAEQKLVSGASLPQAPGAPDVSWLKDGTFEVQEKMEDVPRALILHPDRAIAKAIQQSMETVGYQVMRAGSLDEAMDKLRFFHFSCVVLHEHFAATNLAGSAFHTYMCSMPMSKRRYIFYILLGARLQTLYDMQALALSANLVVNDNDLQYMDIILRKAIPDYEELFGPLLEELSAYGKK